MGVKYNMAVKTGSYVGRDGKEKGKWLNIGVVLEGQYGPYVLLNRHFSPAGVPCDPDKDVVAVSLFKPDAAKEEDVPF